MIGSNAAVTGRSTDLRRVNWPPKPVSIIVDGDSISTTDFGGLYWTNAVTQMFPAGYSSWTNIAVAGQTIATIAANFAANAAPLIASAHAAGKLAIYSVYAGTNDFGPPTGYSDAPTTFSSCASCISQAVAAGVDGIVVVTTIPRGLYGGQAIPQFEAIRQQYNALINQSAASYARGVLLRIADVGKDPGFLNEPTNFGNILYGGDETHPLPAGQQLITNYWGGAVMNFWSPVRVDSITPSKGTSAGGTSCTVRGAGFNGAKVVSLAGVQATGITVVDDTKITCASAAAVGTGTSDVTVFTPYGSGVGVNLYAYF